MCCSFFIRNWSKVLFMPKNWEIVPFFKSNFSYFCIFTNRINEGSQTQVLEGRCPAGFRCFPASTHLIQIK